MDNNNWRAQLPPVSRQRIVNKIMGTLKRHLPVSGQDGLHELQKIAQQFEEKIYTAATSQSDYLRKISLKMGTMETMSQASFMPSNPGAEPTIDTSDWRAQLPPGSRHRSVNEIMGTLRRHLPVFGQDGLHELQKIAQRFEEKNYAVATSQSDYLQKIYLKMFTLESHGD